MLGIKIKCRNNVVLNLFQHLLTDSLFLKFQNCHTELVQCDNFIRKKGFTLAEVLLVLTIIGIIASLTIPNLITTTQNSATVASVRKAYSSFSQAYSSFVADDTKMESIFVAGTGTPVIALSYFATKLNLIKNCGTGTGCFSDTVYTSLNNIPVDNINENTVLAKGILADGTFIGISAILAGGCQTILGTGPLVNTCGTIVIDINGYKKPNKFGRDLFTFWITKTGIFPCGTNNDIYVDDCDDSDVGVSCANKILLDGAVNY